MKFVLVFLVLPYLACGNIDSLLKRRTNVTAQAGLSVPDKRVYRFYLSDPSHAPNMTPWPSSRPVFGTTTQNDSYYLAVSLERRIYGKWYAQLGSELNAYNEEMNLYSDSLYTGDPTIWANHLVEKHFENAFALSPAIQYRMHRSFLISIGIREIICVQNYWNDSYYGLDKYSVQHLVSRRRSKELVASLNRPSSAYLAADLHPHAKIPLYVSLRLAYKDEFYRRAQLVYSIGLKYFLL